MAKDDLDFDTFAIEKERADSVRGEIARLKESGWLDDFKFLAQELGTEDDPFLKAVGEQLELTSISGSTKARAYRAAAGGALEGFLVITSGMDLLVRLKDRSLLEVMALPKAGEFAVLHIDSAFWELAEVLKEQLKDDLKTARQLKSDRQAKFKAAFGGSASA